LPPAPPSQRAGWVGRESDESGQCQPQTTRGNASPRTLATKPFGDGRDVLRSVAARPKLCQDSKRSGPGGGGTRATSPLAVAGRRHVSPPTRPCTNKALRQSAVVCAPGPATQHSPVCRPRPPPAHATASFEPQPLWANSLQWNHTQALLAPQRVKRRAPRPFERAHKRPEKDPMRSARAHLPGKSKQPG
jgi:hypothetical protein